MAGRGVHIIVKARGIGTLGMFRKNSYAPPTAPWAPGIDAQSQTPPPRVEGTPYQNPWGYFKF